MKFSSLPWRDLKKSFLFSVFFKWKNSDIKNFPPPVQARRECPGGLAWGGVAPQCPKKRAQKNRIYIDGSSLAAKEIKTNGHLSDSRWFHLFYLFLRGNISKLTTLIIIFLSHHRYQYPLCIHIFRYAFPI